MIPEKAKARIEELTRKELIARLYKLMDRIDVLEEKLRLKQTPTTSANSSQPPSRDFKGEKKKRRRNRKKGAKFGHEKIERALVDHPSKVIYALVDNRQKCHINLLDQVPTQVIRRQIAELPEIKPVVIETQQYEVICPCCGEVQRGKLPEGMEAGRYFGPRLEATVTMLHHEHHVGFERLIQLCGEIFNLPLSEGGAVSIIKRAGKAVAEEAEKIGEQVRHGQVIRSDETSGRVHGVNWWQWEDLISPDCPRSVGVLKADAQAWGKICEAIDRPDYLFSQARNLVEQLRANAAHLHEDRERIEKELATINSERQLIIA